MNTKIYDFTVVLIKDPNCLQTDLLLQSLLGLSLSSKIEAET